MATEPLIDTFDQDDSDYGRVMFWVFSSAVLLISVLVALIALVNTWWVLGFVFVGHLIATAIVSVVIARALTGRTGGARATDAQPATPDRLAVAH
jgi:membrane protein YdbS with pleckstrin-like domain